MPVGIPKIKIKDKNNLEKDPISGAILSTDLLAKESRLREREKFKQEKKDRELLYDLEKRIIELEQIIRNR